MKVAAWALGLLACAWAETASALEVRFFPAGVLHSYELDAAHGASSLLVHNVAIINDGAQSVTLSEVRLELADAGVVKDVRQPLNDFSQTALYDFGQLVSEMRDLVGSLRRITTEVERDPAGFLLGGQRGFQPR